MKAFRRIAMLLLPAACAAALSGETSGRAIDFLDGFSLKIGEGYEFDYLGDDETFSILTGDGYYVNGLINYGMDRDLLTLKDRALFITRELYRFLDYDTADEIMKIRYEAIGPGISGYWVDYRIAEYGFCIYAVDLRDSPGLGQLMILYFNDFSLDPESQEEVMELILHSLDISFADAAG